MKHLILLATIILASTAFAQIGILTDTPHASSALEIESSNKGLLIPRITLTTNINSPDPVSGPAVGLLIFNSGANQPVGFYYWSGSKWVSTSFSLDNWSISGNSSTSVGTNFLGTTDNQHFAIRTNNNERMRIESDGQVVIGDTSPNDDADLFTVEGNSTQNSAINAYSPGYGVYASAGSIGFLGLVNNESGFGLWAENQDEDGYGAMLVGSDGTAYTLNNHSAGIAASGDDGIFAIGGNSSTGIGIIAGGSGVTVVSVPTEGAGGAFTGQHGVYGKSSNSSGVGVVGVGNDGSNYYTNSSGSGGAFTGFHGVYAAATNSSAGTAVIGVGNGGSYYLNSEGGGGAFTGTTYGISAWNQQSGAAVYGNATGGGWAIYGQGNLGITGSKSFVIDHPLDPENKILKHYCIESPEVLNLYRGITVLDHEGIAQVELPEYFTALNINFSYNLTAIGKPAPDIFIKEEIDKNGKFTIAGGMANQKISWVVYAERNDAYLQQNPESKEVEIEKKDKNKGKYLMPQLYGQPLEKGIFQSIKQDKGSSAETHNPNQVELNSVPQPVKEANKKTEK